MTRAARFVMSGVLADLAASGLLLTDQVEYVGIAIGLASVGGLLVLAGLIGLCVEDTVSRWAQVRQDRPVVTSSTRPDRVSLSELAAEKRAGR